MRLITCSKCNSQFDVASMTAGTSFVCGQCRNVLQVPEAGPVVQPIKRGGGRGRASPPPTVMMTPDQMRTALNASKDVGKTGTPASKPSRSRMEPPPTVAMTPDQMRNAMRGGGQQSGGGPAKLPKAMQRRAEQQSGTQRAGGAQQPPAKKASPSKPSRTKRQAAKPARSAGRGDGGGSARRAPTPRPEAKKKNNTGLIVGIVGGVVVLGAAGFFLFGRGGGDEPVAPGGTDVAGGGTDAAGGATGASPNAGTGGTPNAANPDPTQPGPSGSGTTATGGGTANTAAAAQPLDEIGKFLALDHLAQKDDITRRLVAAKGSLEKLEGLHTWLKQERLAGSPAARDFATRVGAEALRIDANCAWANVAAGRHDLKALLRTCVDECAKAFQFSDDAENEINEKLAEIGDGTAWVDEAEFAKYDKLVAAVRERSANIDSDPRLQQVEEHRDWIRKNDLFKDLNVVARYDDPYIIFQHYPDLKEGMEHYTKERLAKANLFAKRDGIVFRELNRHFRELFGERFELPELREKNRLLRVLVLWDRETFDEWHRRQNTGIPGLVRAYYSPLEKHIVHYVGDDAVTEQDITKCANGRVQKQSDQVTAHEGTHQLHHEYGAIFRGTPLSDGLDIPLNRKSMWFGEGLAEFMGSVEVDEDKTRTLEDATFYHNRILLGRVGGARSMRRNKAPMWKLSDLMLPNNNPELMQKGEELAPGMGGMMANQFYAQAWGFTHFLWFYDDGKYREKYLNFMERVFKHEHGPEALAKELGVPSATDFGAIEDEFKWYWGELLKRKVGRQRLGGGQLGKWFYPETEPPKGRYDPDDTGDDDYE